MATVPIASMLLRIELGTILRCTFALIVSSCELPFASCQREKTFTATAKARPTVQAAKRGKNSRQFLPLAASIHVAKYLTLPLLFFPLFSSHLLLLFPGARRCGS
jgi:hypothetical protein